MEVWSMEHPKLLVEGVSKVFRDGRKSLETLASIDLVVNLGEFVTVIGPSGGGKSTLFNIVAGVDEPFGALDALTRLSLQMWLLELWQTFRSSVLFITHDVREAILLSDRIYVLSSRPARVLRVVEVDLPRPRRSEHLALDAAVTLEQELLTLLMKEQQL